MAARGVSAQGLLVGHAGDADDLLGEQFVGLVLDPLGDVRIGRATVGGVVLEAAAFRRVVRRGDDDAVGQARSAALVVTDDGVGHGRGRRVLVTFGNHHGDAVGRQHFQRRSRRGRGQRVGVGAQEQRAVDTVGLAVQADGLTDSQHVPLVEAQFERAATVAGGTKGNPLGGDRSIRLPGVVRRDQTRKIDQQFCRRQFACEWTDTHAKPPWMEKREKRHSVK